MYKHFSQLIEMTLEAIREKLTEFYKKQTDHVAEIGILGLTKISSARVDLGWTLLCESTYGPRKLRDVILKEYQQFSKSRVHDIEFFEVVAALRRLRVMAISLSGQDDVVGSRPEVDAILEGDTKHVDGVIEILKDRTGITLHRFEEMVAKASTNIKS